MDIASKSVVAKNPNFMDLGMSPANTTDKIKSVIGPTNRVEDMTDSSEWITCGHGCKEVTVGRVSETKAFSDYIKNNEFETMTVLRGKIFIVT